MSTQDSHSEGLSKTETAKQQRYQQQLEEIAESIRDGKEEEVVIQCLNCLPHGSGWKIEEWWQPSSSLNLFQLAVLYRRRNIVEYLSAQHKNYMQKDLYWGISHTDKDCVANSQELISNADQSSRQQTALLQTGPPQQPSVQQTTTASQLPAHQQATQQLPTQQQKGEQDDPVLVNHPLHLACWLGYVDIVRCLTRPVVATAERKKFSHHQEQSSSTTGDQVKEELQDLMKTVSVITVDAVTLTPKSKEHSQGLPLELAVNSGSIGCVKYLLASVLLQWVSTQYYFLCVGLKRKAVSLHLACCFSAPKVVALLLPTVSREILHCQDAQGQTPLHFAVWSGDTDTIRLLLENGADVNVRTYSSSSCLHILYRSKLQPFNYEVNTRMLLQYGADPKAFENNSIGSGLAPLQVVAEEIMDTARHSFMMWKRKAAEKLSMYTRSERPAHESPSELCYLEGLVSCLRLLLEAGADPNLPDTHPLSRKSTLELILSSTRYMLADKNPEILFSVMSLLLEFGATTKQDNKAPHLNHFLCNHLPRITDGSLQARFIFQLCQNGIDADTICYGLVAHYLYSQHPMSSFEWHPDSLLMLVNCMSVQALRSLPDVLRFLNSSEQNKENRDLALSALFGSPVRSLKHTCKLAVLKELRHRSCRVKSLPLPDVVKSYLQGNYF